MRSRRSGTTSPSSTPAARCAESCRSSASATVTCRRSVSRRRCAAPVSAAGGHTRRQHASNARPSGTADSRPSQDAITGPTVDQLTMLVNYRAPAVLPNGERPYRSYEVRHIINSELQLLIDEKPDVDPALFKDKIVFVGLTASGLVDVFQTPFDSRGQGKMPGIQMHASVADSILSNRFIRPAGIGCRMRDDRSRGAIAVGLLAAFFPFTAAATAAVVVMVAWTVVCVVSAFKGGLWLNMAEPLAAMGLALFSGTAYQYFVEGREKRVVKRLFGRYVSKDVYDQLIEHPDRAELGGKRRDMTVLFSDIRGFTSVTEKGRPGGARRAAQRILLPDGRDRLPPPRNGRQVRRRHGDGAVRRPAGRSGPRRARGRRPPSTWSASWGDLNRKWAGEGPRAARHRHRPQFRRHDRRQHRLIVDHELHRHRRQCEPRLAARVAEQGLQDADYHQRRHARRA